MKKICCLLLQVTICLSLILSGCSNNNSLPTELDKDDPVERVDNRFGYKSSRVSIHEDEYSCFVERILYDNNRFYIPVYKVSNDGLSDDKSSIYCVDEDGEVVYTIDFDVPMFPTFVCNGKLAYLSDSNEVVFLNEETGEIDHVNQVSDNGIAFGAFSYGENYLVAYEGKVELYSEDGQLLGSVRDSSLTNFSYDYPTVELNNEWYVVVEGYGVPLYLKLDFDNSSISETIDISSMDIPVFDCYGGYYYTSSEQYRLNVDSLSIEKTADFNDINRIPPLGAGYSNYYSINDTHFSEIIHYDNGNIDVALYTYDESIDYSSLTSIVIGGYDLNYDISLQLAIYNFNISQNQYRVVVQDYSEMFPLGLDTPEERVQQRLNLLEYFMLGNAPDIYCGRQFDYEYMGRNYMIENLLDYMSDDTISLDDMIPSISNILTSNDSCYSLFNSFTFYGYWCDADFEENLQGYVALQNVSNEIQTIGNLYSYQIADYILTSDISNLYDEDLHEMIISRDELIDVIQYSIDNGLSYYSPMDQIHFPRFMDIANGDSALAFSGVSSIGDYISIEQQYEMSFNYYGYPANDYSVKTIVPQTQVAISSTSENKSICWDFISTLFSEEIQSSLIANGLIPVNSVVLDNVLNACSNPSEYSNNQLIDDYVDLICIDGPVDTWIIDDFRHNVDSINNIRIENETLFMIIWEEVITYDTMNKPVEEIADSLINRLAVYFSEYYS